MFFIEIYVHYAAHDMFMIPGLEGYELEHPHQTQRQAELVGHESEHEWPRTFYAWVSYVHTYVSIDMYIYRIVPH